jgi:hypothetical protein
LRESAGLPDSIPVSDPILSSITLADATHAAFVSEVNALEEEVKFLWQRVPAHQNAVNSAWIRFRPNETKFILVGRKQ